MSDLIRCSHCDQPFRVSPAHAGKMVRCPSCKATLKVPAVDEPHASPPSFSAPPPPPPPPVPPGATPPYENLGVSAGGVNSPYATHQPTDAGQLSFGADAGAVRRPSRTPRGMTTSNSFLDIFDLSFTRYVTPLIVKVTWILVLLCGFLWLASLAFGLIVGLGGDLLGSASPPSPSPNVRFSPDRFEAPASRSTSSIVPFVIKMVGYVSFFLAGLTSILWMRVILEGIIVIFKIAETLTEIRNDLSQDRRSAA